MKRALLVPLVALAAALAATQAVATQICLQSKRSGEQVTGELVAFTGRQWDLQTSFGRVKLTIDDFFVCSDPDAKPPESEEERADGPEPAPPPSAAGGEENLSITGSNTVGAAMMPRLVEAVMARVGGVVETDDAGENVKTLVNGARRVRIEAIGSDAGFRALETGGAELAMSSRAITPEEERTIAASGQRGMRDPGREMVIALDGVAPIVSRDNPLETISFYQLVEIFSGRISNWRELGYPEAPIRLYARDAASGTFDTFESLVLAPSGDALGAGARRFQSNAALIDALSRDPQGIGFAAAGALEGAAVKALTLMGECGVAQRPTLFNLKTEDYALGRRLYLYARRTDRTGLLREIADFALSDAAQPLIEEEGFVSQSIAAIAADVELRRLMAAPAPREPGAERLRAELRDIVSAGQRLSVTFRFQTGSAVLDNKARQDATRLARHLAAEAAGRRVLLLGFADSVGGFEGNLSLSRRRAEEARALLRANGVAAERIEAYGYSELLPVFCNDSPSGRAKNRRVEVWVH